ncbi:MAG TPA: HAD-IIA family hydrolase [Candidatus Limnocylindrales bacterium]|nr:HAD-IIA family hydrolase [Candidatus Limnocylindrales bacterium]
MTGAPQPEAALAEALAGVRGFLLDLDGVVILAGRPIPGAAEAIAILDRRGIPFRIVTNTSLLSRRRMSAWGAGIGLRLPAERILSALSLSAAYTQRRYPGAPLFVLASDDARSEFTGQHLLTDDEAGRPGASAAAVVIGDSPESATYDNLNHAFRLVRAGAELIGMHRNPWWLTADGPTLDSGAFVTGLEFATGRRATVIGKPAPAFFREAAAELLAGLPGSSRHDLAMVGDDVFSDVLAAQRLGLRGIFVRTGKHGDAELAAAAARRRGGGRPTAVAASLADVVAALG